MDEKKPKTNAMRMLDQAKVPYRIATYEVDPDDLSGLKVADQVGLAAAQVYKTLVARGDRSGYLVCCLPVDQTVDLKQLAAASQNKRVELIPTKDLLPVTGYIRGGCSPFGMKKKLPTYILAEVLEQPEIAVSAGVRGCQMILAPADLVRLTQATLLVVQ
jgi:Cys-tRNA(Pro)/Cys-tRNA(Cys) deacylase